jgi:hypothetical protein
MAELILQRHAHVTAEVDIAAPSQAVPSLNQLVARYWFAIVVVAAKHADTKNALRPQ